MRFLVLASVVCGSAACGGVPAPAPTVTPPRAVIVRDMHGEAVRDSLVTFTSLQTEQEIATRRTNAAGLAELPTLAGAVAVTATSSNGFAYLKRFEGKGVQLELQLSTACARFQGAVRIDALPGDPVADVVHLVRLGDNVGDSFAAQVTHDGRFGGCLPEGRYAVTLGPAFVERNTFLMIPPAIPIAVRSLTKHLASSPAPPVEIQPRTRDQFVESLAQHVQVLALGESNHGSSEFTLERAELAIALARKRGFRVVLIEASYAGMLPIEDYIQGRNVDLNAALAANGFWLWNTTAFKRGVEQLRAYNLAAAPPERIRLFGIDIQDTVNPVKILSADPEIQAMPEVPALLSRLTTQQGAEWTHLTAAQRERVRAALSRLASAGPLADSDSVGARRALVARALLLGLDRIAIPDFVNRSTIRDESMAAMTRALLALVPQARATLWCHLGHAARAYTEGITTLGAVLAKEMGDGYRAVALLALQGTARAVGEHQSAGPVPHELVIAPPFLFEAALAAHPEAANREITYWPFDDHSATGRSRLSGLRMLRSFGSVFVSESAFEPYDLETIDGAVLFRTVSATTRP